jgi:hypothetical protein
MWQCRRELHLLNMAAFQLMAVHNYTDYRHSTTQHTICTKRSISAAHSSLPKLLKIVVLICISDAQCQLHP